MKLLPDDRKRDPINPDSSGAVAEENDLEKKPVANVSDRGSEKLRETSNEQAIVEENARDYGDKKHIDQDKTNQPELEQKATVRPDAEKKVREQAASRHKMKLRSRK